MDVFLLIFAYLIIGVVVSAVMDLNCRLEGGTADIFARAFINHNLEFVADPNKRVNSYFCLNGCHYRSDVSAKVLEWLSRETCYSCHYSNSRRNDMVHQYHRDGINKFLGTDFTKEDMEIIYTYLGNAIRHQETLEFIRSGYDMGLLTKKNE